MAVKRRDPGPILKPVIRDRPAPVQGIAPSGGRAPRVEFGLDRLVPSIKDPIEEAVKADRARDGAGPNRPITTGANDPSEILRRQRLLKAAGHNVVVDGIWGPRSQAAWNVFTAKPDAPFKREKKGPSITVNRNPETPEMIAAARQQAEREAQKAAFEQRVAETAKIVQRGKVLRARPAAARGMDFREVAEAILDPKTNLGLHTRKGATVFQEWAVANNVPGITVTGKYDRPTHDLMLRELKQVEIAEKRKRVRAIVRDLYSPVGIKGGEKVGWFPLNGGVVPSATELDSIIQSGTTSGKYVLDEILRRAVTSGAVFDPMRRAFLMKQAAILQPFGKAGQPSWLRNSGGTGGTQLQYIAEILGLQTLAPTGDLSGLGDPRLIAKAQDSIYNDPDWQEQNARAVTRTAAEIHALTSSTTPEEFALKLAAYTKKEAAAYEAFQKQRAAESTSWWGEAIDRALAPGKYARAGLVYDAMLLDHLVSRIPPVLDTTPGGNETKPRPSWEDAQAWLGDAPDDYQGTEDPASLWLRLPLEVVVDPLNFAHPFRAASTVMRAGYMGAHGLGYTAAGAGAALGTYRFAGGGAWSKALVYERGTWSKAAALGTVADTLASASAGLALHRTAGFQRAAGMVSRSAALRAEAFRDVRARVEANVRHGFSKPRGMVGAGALPWGVHTPRSNETRTLLNESLEERKAYIMETPALAQIVHDLSETAASLYVHAANPERSNVGQALYANLTEKARVTGLHQAATKEAHRIYNDAMRGVEYRQVDGEITAWLDGQPIDADTLAQMREEAAALGMAEYTKIVTTSGNFLKGGFLSTGGGADKDIMLSVEQHIRRQWDNVDALFPAIQDLLEDFAERNGLSLWDEAGLWAGRSDDAANHLRSLGRESFEDGALVSMPNPQFDIGFTKAQRDDLIAAEVRRGSSRLVGYQARQIAGNLQSGTFDLRAAVDELEEGIWAAWEKRGSEWFDTRAEVEVSDLYTRHTAAAFRPDENGEMIYRGRERTGADDGTWLGRLAQLADAPVNTAGGVTDDALWQLVWDMGGMYKMRLPEGIPDALAGRRYLGPDMSEFENREDYLRALDEHFAQGERLRAALTKAQVATGRAWDEALSKELRKESALWQALAHSQNRFAKLAYLGLKGALNTWVFATLALRPGWMVRNVIDNAAKLIVMGVRDPRMFFLGGANPGANIASVFDMGLVPIRQMIVFLDRMFGTNGLEHWMRLEELIWTQGSDALGSIFAAHGVHVPDHVLEGARFQALEDGRSASLKGPNVHEDHAIKLGLMRESNRLELAGDKTADLYKRFRDGAFELMGNRPENYFKRILYRDEYMKQMDALGASGRTDTIRMEQEAFAAAWAKVEATLFDYSKISVTEDNFRVFFPFIQFWRKNTTFWAKAVASKPWLPLAVLKVDEERREAHADLPDWMKRYIHVDELADAAAVVPGLDIIVKHLIPQDVAYDPFNLLSFAPLYRSVPAIMDDLGAAVGIEPGLQDRLKTENPSLPGENEGHAIFGPMIDALSDWGLGMSPFLRKPLEYDTPGIGNIATERAWQMMFPQTSVAVALTRQFWGDSAALTVAGWESLWGRLPLGVKSESIAEQFDYYVQQFVAEQVARGEQPNIPAAEKAVRHWFLTQNLYGYFTGLYLRRATPEDVILAKLAEADFEDVPEDKREALKLWRMRGADRLSFDSYIAIAPIIEAYYRSPDWQTKVRLKREHPEIIQYVDATWRGRPFSGKWARNATRYTQQAKFFAALNVIENVDAPYDVAQAAMDVFRTPELEAYWQEAQTPAKERAEMIRAAAFEYHDDLNKGYFEIPEDDFEARDGYVEEHPELVRFWNRNNDMSDDYEAMIGGANSALRSIYFGIVKENGGGNAGFAAAAQFLKDFRFMFEDTASAHKIDQETGTWKMGGGGGKGKFSAARLAAFLAAKPHLTWFFETYMKKVGEKAAWAWLEQADGLPAKLIRDYLRQYGKSSQKSIDYMRAKKWLTIYFAMPEAERQKWLAGDTEGAKIVKAYFEKYAHPGGNTQHGKDYKAAKPFLDMYFALPKAERAAWLDGNSREAKLVKAYFKKYGKVNRYARAFLNRYPKLKGGTPEQRKRLEFWRQYFELTPDARPAFVLAQAESHGVFIYGELGEEERHDREMEYRRRAVGLGMNKQQAAYLYAKPLLDVYFTLPKDEKALFVRLNPEVSDYLRLYAKPKLTGNKQLDADIEKYFTLPPDSFARSEWLRKNPKVQDWFDSKASPAEAAMRNLLEQYFSLRGQEREEFVLQHPEIPAYFEDRREARSQEADLYDAFDHSDPRLRQYFADADDLLRAAEEMRRKLRMSALKKFTPDALDSRRDRRQERATL